jgi:hypothetical protein
VPHPLLRLHKAVQFSPYDATRLHEPALCEAHSTGTKQGRRWNTSRKVGPASLGFGVDVGEIDFDSLGPERHQAPTHYVKAALIGLSIVAEIGRGSVGATFQLGATFRGRYPGRASARCSRFD